MQHYELYKYNPSKADLSEIEATFVGRDELIKELENELKKQIPAKSIQNYLIKGPRGIGKTNLLRMILNRVFSDSLLSSAFLPLSFAEEEYSIITLRDFFIKILELLHNYRIDNDEISQVFQNYSQETDDETATENTISFLKNFAKKNNLKLLLLIDNFDLIFGDQIRQPAAAHRLRDVLMNNNFMLLVGTTPTYFADVMQYDEPLYHFFKLYDLEEFDLGTMESLLIKRAKFDKNVELAERIPKFRSRLEGLRHLTGGNPRLALMLYQLIALAELPQVKAMLNMLLDDLTPYYKQKLEKLPPPARKIVDTLARMDKAASPTEIAQQTRIPVNQVSANINRLREEGYIVMAKQERRKATYYILSERLFRIWHQMRYAPNARLRLPFLVEFISIWYSQKEFSQEFKRLEQNYQTSLQEGKKHEALQAVEHTSYLADAVSKAELKYEAFDAVISHYIELQQWDKAEQELCQRVKENLAAQNNERVGLYFYGLGIIYGQRFLQTQSENHLKKACDYYEKSIEYRPDNADTFYNWGNDLGYLAQMKNDEQLFQQAFEKYQRAVEIKPDKREAIIGIGFIKANLREYEMALTYFEQALQLAKKANDQESLKITTGNILQACTDLIVQEINNQNLGQVKKIFKKFLSHKSSIKKEDWHNYLLQLFNAFLGKDNVNIYFELETILREQKAEDEQKLLYPIAKVYEYWQSNEDAEVLDRLNPEVREVVEDILKNVESRKNK